MAVYLLLLFEPKASDSAHGLFLGPGMFPEDTVAGPVFARVFGPQTGVQKNHFFRSLEGAKSLENL